MQRLFTGLQPSGSLHIGNYLGAVKGMLALQADPAYETYYMVADLHALMGEYENPANLRGYSLKMVESNLLNEFEKR